MVKNPMILHEFQKAAVGNVTKAGDRVVLVSPTGSGKTVMAVSLIQHYVSAGASVLFVVHRRELVMQCSRKLYNGGIQHNIIMAGVKTGGASNVHVASIQTLARRAMPSVDVIFIDEAHHAVSNSYMNMLEGYAGKVIGLTATPQRLDGRGLDNVFTDMVVASTMPELIADGFLVEPVLYGFPFEKAAARVKAGDYDAKGLSDQYGRKEVVGKLTENWREYALGRKTVAYAANIAHANMIAEKFCSDGIPSVAVDYMTSAKARAQALRDLEIGRMQVVVNCGLFTEGLDIPDISCVLLSVPTLSVVKYMQMIGRGLRIARDKANCVILDHGGNHIVHGHPGDNRLWSIDGDKMKRCNACDTWFTKGEKLYRDKAYILACPECYAAVCECGELGVAVETGGDQFVSVRELVCKSCGNVYSTEKIKEDVAKEESVGKPDVKVHDVMLALVERLPVDMTVYNEIVAKAKKLGARNSYIIHRLKSIYGEEVAKAMYARQRKEWWNQYAR